jgi:hypothetical protein
MECFYIPARGGDLLLHKTYCKRYTVHVSKLAAAALPRLLLTLRPRVCKLPLTSMMKMQLKQHGR